MAAMWTFALARLAGILALGLVLGLLIGPIWLWILAGLLPVPGMAAGDAVPARPLAAPALAARSAELRRDLGRHRGPGRAAASAQTVPQAAPDSAVPRTAPFHGGAARRGHHLEPAARNRLVQPSGGALARPQAADRCRPADRQPHPLAGVRALSARRRFCDAAADPSAGADGSVPGAAGGALRRGPVLAAGARCDASDAPGGDAQGFRRQCLARAAHALDGDFRVPGHPRG